MLSSGTHLQQLLQTAIQYHQAGNLPQAEAIYRQILSQDPRHADALHLLGVLAKQAGHADASIELIHQALQVRPNFPEALSNVSVTLTEKGRYAEAIQYCLRAIALSPNFAFANGNLANALRASGKLEESLPYYRRAISLAPDSPDFYSNLGGVYQELRRSREAVECHQKALALNPRHAEAYNNLGNALRDLGRSEEAISACTKAVELRPNYPEAYSNMGGALRESLRLDEAQAACEKAIDLRPDFAEAHNNLANILLFKGELTAGWEHYEWRWKLAEFESAPAPPHLRWNGEPLPGGTILLSTEQGFGDAIQFIRYAPMVGERCRRVVLFCRPELVTLMSGMEGIDAVFSKDGPLPTFDAHCPLMSLPRIFGTTLENIPAKIPYLKPDGEKAAAWAQRLAGERRLKIGIAWAGRPTHKDDHNRSVSLAAFAPLAEVADVVFYSLQKGPASQQAKNPPPGMELIDYSDELHDFSDTTALIANLDLIISVDTAVVHAAGAIGRPTWVFIAMTADWRWLVDRTDTAWYPTMRLFRQAKVGQWSDVMQRVREALRQHTLEKQ